MKETKAEERGGPGEGVFVLIQIRGLGIIVWRWHIRGDLNEVGRAVSVVFRLREGMAMWPISSVQSLNRVRLFATLWIAACQASPSITNSWSLPNSCPSSWWCHPAILSSVIPFSSCPQSLPASEAFPISQLFAWSGQSTGVSALASFLPKNIQGWSPLEWTGWISLQSKGLWRVFSNTTVQKHQFFSAQLTSQSNSHIHA